MTDLAHSPLGASSAERWLNCPGSNTLLKAIGAVEETEEQDYRHLGIVAHLLAAQCLVVNKDAWEYVGSTVDADMAEAVQVYLDNVRPYMTSTASYFIEERIGEEPRPHPLFYGTVDFAAVDGEALLVVDYKHGEGIVVEPEENAQMMYYAYGILRRFPRVQDVTLRIVQPRAFHHDGPIREWKTDADAIRTWAETVLVPGMVAAEKGETLLPGSWCRFCPAKLVCPALKGLFGAAANADPKSVEAMTNDTLGREYGQVSAVKMYLKALEEASYGRLMKGEKVPGTKLVNKKANRVFKAGGEDFFKTKYGDDAMHPAELKTPAEMEKVSPAVKKDVNAWAFMPQTGYTVALADDPRIGVQPETPADTFKNFIPTGETTT